jgi:hypothetical protein
MRYAAKAVKVAQARKTKFSNLRGGECGHRSTLEGVTFMQANVQSSGTAAERDAENKNHKQTS